jgi:SOS-response transcriptional repressor LexA
MNVKCVRRENLRALAKAVGGITALANRLGKSQGQISHLIGLNPTKNIGDKLAAEIEQAFNKPPGWLDWRQEPFPFDTLEEDVNYIPLLTSADAIEWVQRPGALKFRLNCPQLAVSTHFSSSAFAMRVLNDTMEAPFSISFPKGSIIIVDPEAVMKDYSFVVVSIEHASELILRQVVHEGSKRYLKAINPRYPLIPMRDPYTIYGVVRMVMHAMD